MLVAVMFREKPVENMLPIVLDIIKQLPSSKGQSTEFSAHICCGQMVGWIKMLHDREVGLSPSDIVLDGDPLPLPKKGGRAHNFRHMPIMAKRLDGSRWYSACR